MAQVRTAAGAGRISRLTALHAPAILRARILLAGGWTREVEQRRLFPWLAVAFGLGILVFFGGTQGAPVLAGPLVAAALLTATTPFLGARPFALALVLAGIAAFLGFAAATLRVQRVAGPILARTTIAPLVGTIEGLDEREEGARLIVRVESYGTLDPALRPTRVRVSYRQALALKPGDRIAATARLLPPPEAARPGGYDFARDAFFRGIGAVGSLVGRIEVRPSNEPLPWHVRLTAQIDAARNALTRRITDANGGQAGAVAAALVTGKRGLINAETNDVLRAAGIYHVVASARVSRHSLDASLFRRPSSNRRLGHDGADLRVFSEWITRLAGIRDEAALRWPSPWGGSWNGPGPPPFARGWKPTSTSSPGSVPWSY